MERTGERTRDIRFYSSKNGDIVCLHSKWARNYAKWLEEQPWVQSYEAGCPFDADIMGRISRAGIRTDYLQAGWATDFVLRYADGHKGVRELILREQLKKKAYVERLELSRRYWAVTDTEWMVVIMDG
ncbi:hypothetical protein [Pseudoflavonifractor phocaeensis]|uniref:hypothetical protein n=1 Tax=Pseudoflavonifractor phocaeensis TaxID=1870988 RepID=UPI00195B7ABA|nr:hypothetical protein [Pseudoflavonifractor phocaeensis]MBM6926912.1 hypothetical protein [Pseudoflavonifractor phocaeensis]